MKVCECVDQREREKGPTFEKMHHSPPQKSFELLSY